MSLKNTKQSIIEAVFIEAVGESIQVLRTALKADPGTMDVTVTSPQFRAAGIVLDAWAMFINVTKCPRQRTKNER